ncbi:MAG: efflux RND transporter periplasmic adaptor subunit [Granulosicoccus sp.]
MRLCTIILFLFFFITQSLFASESFSLQGKYDCVITPSQTVELGSAVPGLLSEVLVDRSSTVKAGQLVAKLDSRLDQVSLDIASLRASSDTELSFRMSTFEIDQRIQERMFALADSDVASNQEKDRASRDAKLAAWRVLQARESMKIDSLEKARAEVSLDHRRIRSPIEGVVLERMHNPGEYIDLQPILRIVSLDTLHVEVILPMRLFGTITSGMRAFVFSELDDTERLSAVVDVVDPMGDASSGTFGARLVLQNPDGNIPAGVKCQVQMLIGDMAVSD